MGPGKYIFIRDDGDGEVDVGENYLKDGQRWNKYTLYNTDGTT